MKAEGTNRSKKWRPPINIEKCKNRSDTVGCQFMNKLVYQSPTTPLKNFIPIVLMTILWIIVSINVFQSNTKTTLTNPATHIFISYTIIFFLYQVFSYGIFSIYESGVTKQEASFLRYVSNPEGRIIPFDSMIYFENRKNVFEIKLKSRMPIIYRKGHTSKQASHPMQLSSTKRAFLWIFAVKFP